MKCLRSELAPLKLEADRLHQLAACILATTPAALSIAAAWSGPPSSREHLLADLQVQYPFFPALSDLLLRLSMYYAAALSDSLLSIHAPSALACIG